VSSNGGDITREFASPRLGDGLASTGRLSEAAIDRALQAISSHIACARMHGADSIRIIGTAACRSASNRSDFVAAIAEQTGIALEVLDPIAEARFSYRGALRRMPHHDGTSLVVDIGGGSTEFTVGTAEPISSASINHGAVVVTEREIRHDPPRPEELTNAIGAVMDDVENLMLTMPELAETHRVIGTAGTIVTIAAIELGLDPFVASAVQGMVLTRDAAEDVFRTVATESLVDRSHNPGLPRQRADIIVAGCCILVGIMRRLRLPSLVVTTHNILDGVAAEMLDSL
jgi:exopolyphosphatase/guanosine-5'-triphosphate,3'-diphosphate pyrophosphatase